MSYHGVGSADAPGASPGSPTPGVDAPAGGGRPLPIRITPEEEKDWGDVVSSALPAVIAVGLLVTILAVAVRVAEYEEMRR